MDIDVMANHFRELYGRDLDREALAGYADVVARLNAAIRDAAGDALEFEDEPSAFLGAIARYQQP